MFFKKILKGQTCTTLLPVDEDFRLNDHADRHHMDPYGTMAKPWQAYVVHIMIERGASVLPCLARR